VRHVSRLAKKTDHDSRRQQPDSDVREVHVVSPLYQAPLLEGQGLGVYDIED